MNGYFNLLSALCLSLSLGAAVTDAFAQRSFYEGKTIRIIVGFSAGGGYDTYSRVMARHLGRHIPGNPTVVVDNMTGAGSLIAANHVYRVAKPDGLTIGHFIGGLFLQQMLEKPGVEFDSLKFEFIGAPAQDHYMIGVAKAAGVASVEQWIDSKKTIKFGGVGAGSATDDLPKMLMATIGLPVQLVSGYKGTSTIRLAFAGGEVQGVSNAWESFKATWSQEVRSGEIFMALQCIPARHPDLPNVPLAIELAKTEEARQLIRATVHTVGPTARPYVLPPGTPKDRVELLRGAFIATMKDPEFLAEAAKAKLDVNPLEGKELERNVREVFNLDPALRPRVKEILK